MTEKNGQNPHLKAKGAARRRAAPTALDGLFQRVPSAHALG